MLRDSLYQYPTRWDRFKCWLIYGHCWDKTDSSYMMSRTMNRCKICGKVEAGPD